LGLALNIVGMIFYSLLKLCLRLNFQRVTLSSAHQLYDSSNKSGTRN
jgi:hypothetical protein